MCVCFYGLEIIAFPTQRNTWAEAAAAVCNNCGGRLMLSRQYHNLPRPRICLTRSGGAVSSYFFSIVAQKATGSHFQCFLSDLLAKCSLLRPPLQFWLRRWETGAAAQFISPLENKLTFSGAARRNLNLGLRHWSDAHILRAEWVGEGAGAKCTLDIRAAADVKGPVLWRSAHRQFAPRRARKI